MGKKTLISIEKEHGRIFLTKTRRGIDLGFLLDSVFGFGVVSDVSLQQKRDHRVDVKNPALPGMVQFTL